MARSFRQNNQSTLALNNSLDQVDLADIYRTYQPKEQYTFFPSTYRKFSRIDHIRTQNKFLINLRLKSHQASFPTTIV